MSIMTKASAVRSRSLKAAIGAGVILTSAALVLSGCSTPSTGGDGGGKEDIALKIGTALPQTGNLAFLGPPEEAGVAYATSLINDATADTGLSLDVVYGDSGDTDNKAYETEIPRLLGEKVSALREMEVVAYRDLREFIGAHWRSRNVI